jgi:TolB protein
MGGDVFTMTPIGRDLERLTDDGLSYAAAWSPDGRWIAFNSQRDGNSEVYVMKPDGSGQHRLTIKPRPTASPHGSMVVTAGRECVALLGVR